ARSDPCAGILRLVVARLIQLPPKPPPRRVAPGRPVLSQPAFGCPVGSPPAQPGAGMTLTRPPLGGATCISESTPAGGQMTPFDWASLSLNGAEPPPPTVGGSPFISGGHVAPFSRDGFALGCASAKF